MLDYRTMEPALTLKDQRRASRVTQRDMAERLGVSVPAVCNWEAGKAWPSIDRLPALAALLGVDMDRLVRILIKTRGGEDHGEL